MATDTGLASRAEQLRRARVPYVRATVVRALHPTSAHAGDTALVHGDGVIEGFVGGACAESSVRRFALEVLVTGEPLLLRVTGGAPGEVLEEGAVTVANPCLSGGSLEVFLEPVVPPARLVVVGTTPVAAALVALGEPLGFAVQAGPEVGAVTGAAAVVVASHGRGEEPALAAALAAGVPYVGLVASRVRASAVLGGLAAPDAERVHSPAGLDLGCRTAPEIALSILAQVVATRSAARPAEPAAVEPQTALDPVCGMTVAVSAAAPQAEVDGVVTWFCCQPCRTAFLADPDRYAR